MMAANSKLENRSSNSAMSTANYQLPITHFVQTASAFDGVASEYDGPLGNNTLIQRIRSRVIARVVDTFPRGSRLLDLGCGTGIDAVDLASRGYEIVAIDSSRAMIDRACMRIRENHLERRTRAIQVGIHELDRLREEPFDGLYSNLGPLNCIPDLTTPSREMGRLLKPHGRIIASVIGKYCPWEFTFYALRFNLHRARTRLTNSIVSVPLRGETVWTRYCSPSEFYQSFADEFQRVALRSLNLFLPPPYLVHAYERYHQFFRPLAFLDDRLGGLPLMRNLGDHFMIELQKRD